MRRLYVVVEGQTEEEFVKRVLIPHLRDFGLWVITFIVETGEGAAGRRRGGGKWSRWVRDLKGLSRQQDPELRFTTLFDLYGLPPDGSDSAPSKRLQALIPSYRKTGHGPLVLESAGLSKLRERCPRFSAWVARLEELGSGSAPAKGFDHG